MNVSHLQQHLADLAKLLDASGAGKAVVQDLHAIAEQLGAFRDMPLRAFADFLKAAEDAVRKGEALPPPGKKPKRAAVAPKPPKADVAAVAREVKDLYEHAGRSDLSDEQIDAVLARVDGLTQKDLVIVAEGMQIPLRKSEKKANIIKTIRFWITDRRGKAARAVLGN